MLPWISIPTLCTGTNARKRLRMQCICFGLVVQSLTVQLFGKSLILCRGRIPDQHWEENSRPQDCRPWPPDPPSTFDPPLGVCLCCSCRWQIPDLAFPEPSSSLPLPAVLTAPIRLDVVAQVHSESFPIAIT